MPAQAQETQKILRRFKGLSRHLQEGEIPLFTVPAIWDSGQELHSTACDIIITNQRLFGYIYTRFPRERLLLDALPLGEIKAVSLRQKSFEPVFRELFVSTGKRSVYIRAPRQKIESLYSALADPAPSSPTTSPPSPSSPAYGKQDIRVSFERSLLAVILLFVGGLILEIGGVLLWSALQSAQTGLPLCIAGFIAVVTSILVSRQRR
jgi:hypothetical protein